MTDSGIVVKVWNVHGTEGNRSESTQVKDSIEYILDEEKTSLNNSTLETHNDKQLSRECKYIENDLKTEEGALVATQNLKTHNLKDIVKEMMETKKTYGKLNGRSALHGTISLSEFDSQIPNASSKLSQLCNQVMRELFPNHQAVFAVHTNTDNLHIHFLVNSVGLDGRKIHQPENFVRDFLQPAVNRAAKKYGFTPNEKWKQSKETKNILVQNKIDLRKSIDRAIEETDSFEQFVDHLKGQGIVVNVGKHISLKNENMLKAMRTHQLGSNYSKDSIVERIVHKRDTLQSGNIGNYAKPDKPKDIVIVHTVKMKKYKSMTPEEKKKTIALLKKGHNPWRINSKQNWQINKIAYEMNRDHRALEYVNYYTKDGSVQSCLNVIVDAKKKISLEKKELKLHIQKYKPIIDIYKEMKKIEDKAFLYEYKGDERYRVEYEEYRELTRRLKNNYGKDIYEVDNFMTECKERIMYATAQLSELSQEYKEVKSYAARHKIIVENPGIAEVIGLDSVIEESRMGMFTATSEFVVTDNPEIILNVQKFVYQDENGRNRQGVEIKVINREGEIIDKIDNREGNGPFRAQLRELASAFNLKSPVSYSNVTQALDHIKYKKQEYMQHSQDEPIKERNEKCFSFVSGINQGSIGNKGSEYIVSNRESSPFVAVIITTQKEITIDVINRQGETLESFAIPGIHNKTQQGFETIQEIQKKYGFSDDVLIYDSLEEANKDRQEEKAENKEKNEKEQQRKV